MKGLLLVSLACAACGLFPNVGDLEGVDAAMEASADVVVDAPIDAASDASTDAPADAFVDSATDASWSFVSTVGNYVPSMTTTVSMTTTAVAGNLIVIGCDTEAKGGVIKLDTKTAALAPHTIGPLPNTQGSFETMIFWGVIATTPSSIAMTATTSASVGFLDCSINVYAGGTSNASVIASKETDGTGQGLVQCGPVLTSKGGVAYYVSVRYMCAGAPSAPFVQREDLEGNPTGDFVPSSGVMAQTTLADCQSSTGDWECLTVAFSP